MLDLGFDEEVHRIMNHFSKQRQTLLFSATMPKKFQDFARGALVDSITVNVSRAGAANLDVIQEVEYVKLEARIVYLLECLQKTAPPVLQVLDEPEERGEGCAFCGGLGHTILDCPKRDKDARRLNANRRDMLSGTGGPGGDW